MHPQEILTHVRRAPFQPFRVYVSDGSSYDVLHPEMAIVSRRDVVIAVEIGEDQLADRVVFCDLLHITRIEPIDQAKSKASSRRRK